MPCLKIVPIITVRPYPARAGHPALPTGSRLYSIMDDSSGRYFYCGYINADKASKVRGHLLADWTELTLDVNFNAKGVEPLLQA